MNDGQVKISSFWTSREKVQMLVLNGNLDFTCFYFNGKVSFKRGDGWTSNRSDLALFPAITV